MTNTYRSHVSKECHGSVRLAGLTSNSGLFKRIGALGGHSLPRCKSLKHPNRHVEERLEIVSTANFPAKHIVDTGKAHRSSGRLAVYIGNVCQRFIIAVRLGKTEIYCEKKWLMNLESIFKL